MEGYQHEDTYQLEIQGKENLKLKRKDDLPQIGEESIALSEGWNISPLL